MSDRKWRRRDRPRESISYLRALHIQKRYYSGRTLADVPKVQSRCWITARHPDSRPQSSKSRTDRLIDKGVVPPRPEIRTYDELVELGVAPPRSTFARSPLEMYKDIPTSEEFWRPREYYAEEMRVWREERDRIIRERDEARSVRKKEKKRMAVIEVEGEEDG